MHPILNFHLLRPWYHLKKCLCISPFSPIEQFGFHKLAERFKLSLVITRLTAHFTCGLMSDLVICKCRKEYGHEWHQMSLLRPAVIKNKKNSYSNSSFVQGSSSCERSERCPCSTSTRESTCRHQKVCKDWTTGIQSHKAEGPRKWTAEFVVPGGWLWSEDRKFIARLQLCS